MLNQTKSLLNASICGPLFSMVTSLLIAISAPNAVLAAEPSRGCDAPHAMTHSERLAVVNQVVADAETEMKTTRAWSKNPDVFERVATFAAGSVEEDFPLFGFEMTCWSKFYDAQKKLKLKDEKGAHEDAQDWKTCIESELRERLDIAQPYFSCFPGPKTKSDKDLKGKSK